VEVEELRPRLWCWRLRHPESGELVSSYAEFGDDVLVLFDPLVPPADTDEADRFWEALDREIEQHGPPAILLTVYRHARSSQEILERHPEGRLFAHEPQAEQIAERAAYTETFSLHEVLPGHVIPFDAGPGSEVIFWAAQHRAMVAGDVLAAGEDGVRLAPTDSMPREQLVETLRPVLVRSVDMLLLTHGGPVLEDAHGALERALLA
jgi:glyoxylase-like metal-dependent hydrolase (beta-lactamase superfamily II)